MAEPTSSYRTSASNKKSLKDLHQSVSAGTEKAVDAYVQIRPKLIKVIENKFTPAEIGLLAEALKGSAWDPVYATNTDILISKVAHSKQDFSPDEKGTLDKIKDLSPAECYFLQEEIYRRINK